MVIISILMKKNAIIILNLFFLFLPFFFFFFLSSSYSSLTISVFPECLGTAGVPDNVLTGRRYGQTVPRGSLPSRQLMYVWGLSLSFLPFNLPCRIWQGTELVKVYKIYMRVFRNAGEWIALG